MPAPSISRWTLALVFAAGCRPGTRIDLPESEPEPTAASSDETGADSVTPSDELPAEPTHPLEMVPARGKGLIMAKSLQRVAEIWERERLVGLHPEFYATMAEPFVSEFGHDLLDPAETTKIGVDPTAPVGMALLDPHDSAFMVFGGLTDSALFMAAFERVTEEPLVVNDVGTAKVIPLSQGFEKISLVLRGDMFALVFFADGDFDGVHPFDYAREVATVSPSGSLAHAHSMKRAHAVLSDDADFVGLLDPAGLFFGEIEWSRRRSREALSQAEVQLAEARRRGASSDELRGLQEVVNVTRADLMEQEREFQIINLLLSRTVGSIEGVGMSVQSGEEGLLGGIHIALTPDSVLRDLLISDERPPRALLAADLQPLFAVAGRLDVGLAIELFAQLALATGSSYAELNAEIERDIELDFDRQLRPLLDGRAALVVVDGEPVASDDANDFDDWFSGAITLGVHDEAKARALLRSLSPALMSVGWQKTIGFDGYNRTMRSAPEQLWLAVVGDQIVLSTDLPTLQRIAEGKPGTASTTMPSPAAWARLAEGATAARAAVAHGALAMTFFGFAWDTRETAAVADQDDFAFEGIPPGIRVQQASQDVHILGQKIFRLEQRQSSERAREGWRRMTALGMTIGAARMTETGILIEGGHYIRGGMGKYIETFMGLGNLDEAPTSVDDRLEELRNDQRKARERFNRLRQKEIDKARRSRPRRRARQ
ncbi:MAG: hypothetical protein AAF799_39670 [Myxococcota bacterium]